MFIEKSCGLQEMLSAGTNILAFRGPCIPSTRGHECSKPFFGDLKETKVDQVRPWQGQVQNHSRMSKEDGFDFQF